LDLAPEEIGRIAGMDQRPAEIDAEAVRLISQGIYDNTPGLSPVARMVLIDPVFVDGPSLGPV
jgi:hypothetical protein